ncbi:hypothetical protein L1987_77649 [Smallanthus sonchifolius]|uniref:Uncharacterized protein n=1 Tax=Smallanthus sonchifolius TaxID=185202 RepID=A0ACB8ZBK7_9ASTR|nr:hypothetical protein L1987_77649 [Smallanthus sonchifolius]
MDWNLNAPTEWDWDTNLVVDNVDFSLSGSVDSSSKETIKTFDAFDDLPTDLLVKEESSWLGENVSFSNMVEEASVLSGEAMIGLKLGKHACTSSSNNMTDMIKRSRASYHSSQSQHCQVEGCNLDLSSAKDYHCRNRIYRRPQMNFLLNRGSIPILDSAQLQHFCNFKGEESLIGLAKGGGIDVLPTNGTLSFSSERFMPRNTNLNASIRITKFDLTMISFPKSSPYSSVVTLLIICVRVEVFEFDGSLSMKD